MASELIDTITSLVSLMREETAQLTSSAPREALHEIAAAKTRLVAAIETQVAQLERESRTWQEDLEGEARDQLVAVLDDLRTASAENADILKRQIDLSMEIFAAIAAEAQRLSGTRSETYGASGDVFRMDLATPISINTKL